MDMSGEQLIAAPRGRVWEALNDPDILGQCIPGCESIEKTSDTGFEAAVTAKIGPVKAKFKGAVELQDLDPPNSYTIVGEGKGGAAGFGKGSAKVQLEDAEGGTLMRYDVKAQVGGKLAQIGSRLVDSAAKKMADDFFDRFKSIVEAGAAAAATPPAAEPEAEAAAPAAAAAAAAIAPEAGAAHAAATHHPDPAPHGAHEAHGAHGTKPLPPAGGLPAWVWGAILVIAVIVVAYLVTGH